MENRYKELFKYILETDESCMSDIIYSLELVKSSLDTTMSRIKKEISMAADNNSFDGVAEIASYCKRIKEIDEEIEDILLTVCPVRHDEKIEAVDSTQVNDREKVILDYSKFDVCNTDPHSLDEDFEYKKICGINIKGKNIAVSSWQDALVKLCDYLNQENPQKFKTLVGNPIFRGRKVQYFMTEAVQDRNKLVPGTNIYVWTNNSANSTVALMKKILNEFKIPLKNTIVYLRRDLQELYHLL